MSADLPRDALYFCEDVFLQVDGTLFKVPKAIFEGSEIFRDMFSVPPPPDQIVEGFSVEHPIRLDGIAAVDFRRLLTQLLPLPLLNPKVTLSTVDEWLSVLRLSTMWAFKELRATAKTRLEELPLRFEPVHKIIVAKELDMPSWLFPAIQALARRDAPLTLEETERLLPAAGLDFVLKIAALRESDRSVVQGSLCSSLGCGHTTGPHWTTRATIMPRSQYQFEKEITTLFGLKSPKVNKARCLRLRFGLALMAKQSWAGLLQLG